MRQTKSVLALLLTLCMLLGMLPGTAWAAESDASLKITSIEGRTCTNGEDGETQTAVYGLKFTTTVPDGMKGCIVLLAYDPEKIQAVQVSNIEGVDYYQDTNTSDGSQDKACFDVTGKATTGVLGKLFDTTAASWRTIDGKTTVQYSVGYAGTVTNKTETQDMFNFYYRLQEGTDLADLTAGKSIGWRFLPPGVSKPWIKMVATPTGTFTAGKIFAAVVREEEQSYEAGMYIDAGMVKG